MAKSISNMDDVIDSRDVIARITELENIEPEELDDEELEELTALKALAEEGNDATSSWEDGEALIRDSYFEEYAEQLADDIGAIDRSASWPVNCIDWKQAARELQYDYTTVDFGGETYWIRSC